ncbi:hypothetical protein RclHR1_03570003 [Rhizophagus clarus]|uniref:Uncharacterized protein n=1 Tax=Rhizophagus clarus TaxID=94130 RepID=A0A2Z6RAZ8_9GLOM|nr:hypothetical protein RclHR1_03570003 [Rhizophagus clarus]GET02182.1 hypothetical protein GLOIN_2v1761224 [Rhizophagus clarus]
MTQLLSIFDRDNETAVQEIARKCGKVPLTLPVVPHNENTARAVLSAVKSMMTLDDPAIVIQWNAPGFNDVPASLGLRNGVTGQTMQAIINHFTTNGGTDVYGQNTVFVFRTNDDLGQCENRIPGWARHQTGIPDVCISAVMVHKLTMSGRMDVSPFDYAFNR